ncbi:hypothetical protein Hypma_000470 [Hypsizygus marmoreus]|uniref:Uncharacterized protein n=1 Tax=Hypsizygus marmoreus TaxID=39966 RepID=A0A369JHF1_HYPMA|nr:hypothetical protein Hypma_000470 [Hypsizygus marmoreus]
MPARLLCSCFTSQTLPIFQSAHLILNLDDVAMPPGSRTFPNSDMPPGPFSLDTVPLIPHVPLACSSLPLSTSFHPLVPSTGSPEFNPLLQ